MLLILFSVIMAGCATSAPKQKIYFCEKPQLKGPTWADVAILSVDQAAAIEICNTLNGLGSYEPYVTEKK